ncbi:MAG: hypothetical protein RJQ08_02020 [Salinisphaeraceae bacterium]
MNRRSSCTALATVLWLAGCVNTSVEQLRQSPPGAALSTGESVVVLGRSQQGEYRTEGGFTQCVADRLDGPDLPVTPAQTFNDRLFPWFEPRTAPQNVDDLRRLLDDPLISQRLQQNPVRYLVWVDGTTRDTDSGGSMGCAVGPGGGGCLGFAWWEKNAAFEASVWDVTRAAEVGRVSVDASGTSYMPAVIVPVPLLARTEAAACSGLGDQLRELLVPDS